MKKLAKISVLLFAVVLIATGCKKLPEFTDGNSSGGGTNDYNTIPLEYNDTINFDGKVVVLLENYSGVKCINCPEANALASQLENQYDNHLIIMNVHPQGPLQNPAGGFPDFRTDDGNEWNDYFSISAYPVGTINRYEAVYVTQWTEAIDNVIDNDTPVRLIIKSKYNYYTRDLQLSIHSKFLSNVNSNDVRLIICMVEDNITGKQATASGIDTAYVHHHIFRGTADSLTWGRKLDSESNSIIAGTNFITNMKFHVDDNYCEKEFYIVAIITDNTTKRVLMAAEKKIL